MKKKMIVIASAAVLAAAVTMAALYGSKVEASLSSPDDFVCSLERPIIIRIKNYSFRRIINTKFSVELWKDGRSENLLIDNGATVPVFSRYVVEPFSTKTLCLGDDYFPQEPVKPVNDEGRWELLPHLLQVNRYNARAQGAELVIREYSFEFQ